MKWFKHDSDAFTSEGVENFIESEGFAGYGRWCRLLEIVAFKMDKTTRCHVEYPASKWCSLLKLKQKKLISFLEATQKQLRTKVVYSDNKVRIEIPNLLKKRDNYTKDLQETAKLLPSKEREREVERDKDKDIKEKGKKKTPSPVIVKTKRVSKLTDDEWIISLKENAAYKHLDLEKLNGKMMAWCELKGRQPTRKMFLNWLNREDAPMNGTGKKKSKAQATADNLKEIFNDR